MPDTIPKAARAFFSISRHSWCAAVPAGERVGAQKKHCPHHLLRKRGPDAAGVADDQIPLEPLDLIAGYHLVAQGAETRGYPIDLLAPVHHALHRVAPLPDAVNGPRHKSDSAAKARHLHDLLNGQGSGVYLNGRMAGRRLIGFRYGGHFLPPGLGEAVRLEA
jgi:hypothetical protein